MHPWEPNHHYPRGDKKPLHSATCLIEQDAHSNLPFGLIVNRCLAHAKAKLLPIILVNTSSENVWIRQPLLAAELLKVECHSWDSDTSFNRLGSHSSPGHQLILMHPYKKLWYNLKTSVVLIGLRRCLVFLSLAPTLTILSATSTFRQSSSVSCSLWTLGKHHSTKNNSPDSLISYMITKRFSHYMARTGGSVIVSPTQS